MAVTFTRTSSGAVKIVDGSNKPKSFSGFPAKIFASDDGVNVHIKIGGEEIVYKATDISTINGSAAPATAELIAESLRDSVFFLASTIYFNDTTFTGTGSEASPITAMVKKILVSNVALSHTGNTTETTVYTGTIPANSIGPNGCFEIIALISAAANNANVKNVRLKFNGTTIATMELASTLFRKSFITIHNRNSLAVQVSGAHDSQAQLGTGTSGIARATYAFNTAANITVTITIQNANAADTSSVEAFQLVGYY